MTEPLPFAEQALIGAALLSADVAADLAAAVPAEAFADVLCRAAFQAISAAVGDSAPTDLVSIAARVAARGKGILAAPHTALYEMQAGAVAGQYEWLLGLVVESWTRRVAVEAGKRFLQQLEGAESVADAIDAHRAGLESIGRPGSSAVAVEALLAGVMDVAEKGQTHAVIRTPWSDLNRIVTMRPGNFVVVAARPGAGKSVVLSEMGTGTASTGHGVVLFSLEMTATEIGQRILASRSRVLLDSITSGTCSDDDWKRIAAVSADVAALTLTIDDDASASLASMRAYVRRHKPSLVLVDYLQLMHGPRSESRQNDVATLSRGLKQLAKDAECVVAAAAQLNRSVEGRQSKVPVLSDLRESGQIEQDADIVILLHREDMYERESPRAGELDVIVAKNRSGSTATVTLGFDGKRSRIVQLAPEYQSYPVMGGNE